MHAPSPPQAGGEDRQGVNYRRPMKIIFLALMEKKLMIQGIEGKEMKRKMAGGGDVKIIGYRSP